MQKGTNVARRPLLRRGGGGGGQREERASPSSRHHHHHHHHARRGVRETLVVVDVGEGLCRPRKMEALQSPQCDDDDYANATTTGKKHHHPSDGEEREQKLQRRTGRVRVSKVRRAKIGPAFRSPNDARAFDLVGTFDLEMMCISFPVCCTDERFSFVFSSTKQRRRVIQYRPRPWFCPAPHGNARATQTRLRRG